MSEEQLMVRRFHEKFGATVGKSPELRDRELRAKLILEEAVETVAAMGFHVWANIESPGTPGEVMHQQLAYFHKAYDEPDFIETIDGWCDLLYVIYGSAVAAGVNLAPFFAEVHETNMAKEGGATRADGKVLKPAGWQAPELQRILDIQRGFHECTEECCNTA